MRVWQAIPALAVLIGATMAQAAPVGDVVRVNSIVGAPTKTLGEAEASAKRTALSRVLKMRGNDQIRGAASQIMARVNDFVSVRHVLNKDKAKGLYQPAFYLDVNMEAINEIVVARNEVALGDYNNPRIQVAIVIRRLPKDLSGDEDREVYVDDLNETVKEYYGRAGFNLVDFLNFEEELIYSLKSIKKLEKAAFNSLNPPTAIDYYLLGQLDVPNGSIKARDGGAYYKARAKLQIKLLDLNTGQPVSASRTVEGTGDSARASLDVALRNAVKAIQEKASAPDILKAWQRNIQRGMVYEITFCEKELNYAYFNDLRDALGKYGGVSGSKSDVVPLHEFKFPGGRALDPSTEFTRMLKDVQGATGRYSDTEIHPIIYKKHKVFMFGNSPDCFGAAAKTEVVQ